MFQRSRSECGSRVPLRAERLEPQQNETPGTIWNSWNAWNLVLFVALLIAQVDAQSPKRVTIDDLMALRTINDVKISPSGDRIAYTVSTPSVPRNAHEAALF